LLDKISTIKTVVNKINEIDSTYRNFNFEILAGESNTLVQVKENNCQFRFDFATVYWNPRLATEHERVVQLLKPEDIVYDVFAGVGPFSIPAVTHRKCHVICNDLNPNSYKYLTENYSLNNKKKAKNAKLFGALNSANTIEPVLSEENFSFDNNQVFLAYNLDGNDFIKKKLKFHLIEMINHRLNQKSKNR
jgi:tRNA G37 N-methylase Trm5